MELGEKIRLARQEAGLSQRQLCGEEITRNMLSLIEHGNAKPSMDTLRYLASRLNKPISYFLDEQAMVSPNQECILGARKAFQEADYSKARLLLENFREPDPIFCWEYRFLRVMSTLAVAEEVLAQGKDLYAGQLLEEIRSMGQQIPGADRQRLLLMARIKGADLRQICRELPDPREELLIRARACVSTDPEQSLCYSRAAGKSEEAKLLMGTAYLNQRNYRAAAECFHQAEEAYPAETAPLLEQCYRELEDYKRAYEYARKLR